MKTEVNIHKDFLKAQMEFGAPKKSKEGQLGHRKYKYADLEEYLDCVVPSLHKHGFYINQKMIFNEGRQLMTLSVTHESGESIHLGQIEVGRWADDPQKMGSEITYMRRYQLAAAFGLVADDDDAKDVKKNVQAVSEKSTDEKLTKDQANHIKTLVKGNEDLLVNVLKMAGKKMIGDFEQNRYEGIVRYIEQEIKKGVA